jgi:hypothetical protein
LFLTVSLFWSPVSSVRAADPPLPDIYDLRIEGDGYIGHPFGRLDDLDFIVFRIRYPEATGADHAGTFVLHIAPTPDLCDDLNGITIHGTFEQGQEEVSVPLDEEVKQRLREYGENQRYYIGVEIPGCRREGYTDPSSSWETAQRRSHTFYESSSGCVDLPESFYYYDFFALSESFTGYTWDLAPGSLRKWELGKAPQIVWGPRGHHSYGETSGTTPVIRARDGNLYAIARNPYASEEARKVALLRSTDNGQSWTIVNEGLGSDPFEANGVKLYPLTLAYAPPSMEIHPPGGESQGSGDDMEMHQPGDGSQGGDALNVLHIICAGGSETGFSPPFPVYDVPYDGQRFLAPVRLNENTQDGAAQVPSAAVDADGILHVVWYHGGAFGGGGDPRIRYARLLFFSEEYVRVDRSWVKVDGQPVCGMIPNIYAAPTRPMRLHLFYVELGKGPAHLGHLINDFGPYWWFEWREAPPPFASPDPLTGAFSHSVYVEYVGDTDYRLHFVAVPFQEEYRQELWYNVYDSFIQDWFYDPSRPSSGGMRDPFPTIFDIRTFLDATQLVWPENDVIFTEYPAVTMTKNGTMVVAARIRFLGPNPPVAPPPENSCRKMPEYSSVCGQLQPPHWVQPAGCLKPLCDEYKPNYETSDHWLRERDVLAWILKRPGSDRWEFSPENILGDLYPEDGLGIGIGAYRAFFPYPGGAAGTDEVGVLWEGAAHYSRGRPFSDMRNPYGFNAFKMDGEFHHVFALFHGLFFDRLPVQSRPPLEEARSQVGLVPLTTVLAPPAPNPFSRGTSVGYRLAEPGTPLFLGVYDAAGRLVRTLVRGVQETGWHRVTWDGRDAHGRRCATGVYFLRMKTGERELSRRILLLR